MTAPKLYRATTDVADLGAATGDIIALYDDVIHVVRRLPADRLTHSALAALLPIELPQDG